MVEKDGVTGLSNVHHYETTEMKDAEGRKVLDAGLQVDENFTFQVGDKTYTPVQQVTNQQYEVDKNESKRRIANRCK